MAGRALGIMNAEEKRRYDLAQTDRVRGLQDQQLQRRQQVADAMGVDVNDPRVTDTAGLESISPAEYLTPVGDLVGLADAGRALAQGDYLTAGLAGGLTAASIFLPGTIRVGDDAVKDMGAYSLVKRDPTDPRVYDYNMPGYVDDKVLEMRPNDVAANTNVAARHYGKTDVAHVTVHNDVDDLVRGRDVYVPFIGGEQKRQALGTRMTQQEMDRGVFQMLSEIPNGAVVTADSFSDNSLPIILKRWESGRLSGIKPKPGGEGYVAMTHNVLNDMGLEKYTNHPAVEAWHDAQAFASAQRNRSDPEKWIVGKDKFGDPFDNRFHPSNQMTKDEFFQIHPEAAKHVAEGNTAAADRMYDHYRIQSNNDFGISPLTGETNQAMGLMSEDDALELAELFNKRMRDAAANRQKNVSKHTSRGKSIEADEGVYEAVVKPRFAGQPDMGYIIEYPTPVMVKNFQRGGRMKLKKKRRPGMMVV